jgi:aquaglyceroporin related protein
MQGTVQLTLGFCTSLSITTSRETDAVSGALGWGLASMVGIYVAGGISGAHLNPAISIMLWIYRGFPLRKVFLYVPAQLLAGFVAALISYGIHRQNILEYGGPVLGLGGTANSFVTSPRHDWIDASTAFFTEFTGTAILAISVLALGDDSNAPPGAGMNALVIGLIITSICMAFGNNTGIAMNPSRDFGPRLALLALGYGGDLFRNGWWVYGPWAGTITGAIFGAGLYDIAIFVGGESPINYPRRRMKRAGRKWRKKWAGRIWRAERKMKGGVNEEHSS